ncbi:MAG: 3-ketoacyl-ACP reductase [Candidatus Aminicenantes bacterium]|nr:3-ketoacyl-ACP reductase [Candidatus Aminicenantes bacterium]
MTAPSRRPVALVTGAGRGIGRGIALALAAEGYDIAGCDIVFDPGNAEAGLFEVKARVEEAGSVFLPVAGDIADLAAHGRIIGQAADHFGRIDLLVNNAGIAPDVRRDILETTPGSFDRVLGTNLRGPFFLTQGVVRRMTAWKDGVPLVRPAVVFITSISASVSSTARAEYCVSKAGLGMTARLFADRLAEAGINVYEIRPGLIRTVMTAPVRDLYDRRIADGLVPQGRWGLPEDIGRAAAALARGDFGFSTGLVLEVSGGMNIRRL